MEAESVPLLPIDTLDKWEVFISKLKSAKVFNAFVTFFKESDKFQIRHKTNRNKRKMRRRMHYLFSENFLRNQVMWIKSEDNQITFKDSKVFEIICKVFAVDNYKPNLVKRFVLSFLKEFKEAQSHK